MEIYVVAKKYLLPKLQEAALAALYEAVDIISPTNTTSQECSKIVELLQLLEEYKDHNAGFAGKIVELSEKHLPALLREKEFRQMLETNDAKPVLELVLKAVERGHGLPLAITKGQDVVERTFKSCPKCRLVWAFEGWELNSEFCPNCRDFLGHHSIREAVWWSQKSQ